MSGQIISLIRGVIAAAALLLSGVCSATVDQYNFDSPQQQAQFMSLIEELRCPKCQNQNLADSNAEIAKDMRNEVYRLMDLGKSDDEIVTHLVDRYGDFVRYKPPMNTETLFLWGLPILLLLIGLCIVIAIARKQQTIPRQQTGLSEHELALLKKIREEDSQ